MKKDTSAYKFVLICLIGILFNLAGAHVAKVCNLSIYMDTIGTIFIAVIGGYVPGISVGFFTNLIGSYQDWQEMHYGVVSISVALISTFLARRGYYEKFSKVVLTIPFTILVTAFFGTFIKELLSGSNAFLTATGVWDIYEANFFRELPDKSLSIIASFFLLKLFPSDWRERFKELGKMQAPLSPEMRKAINAESKIISSLRTKIIFNLMLITLFVAVTISGISYTIYTESAKIERIKIADGIISMVVSEINPDRVDEFIELGRQAEGYNEVEKKLYRIRASNSDIRFLYVYKIMEDGCHVVFDLETASVEASEPGDIEEFDEEFFAVLPSLLAGKPIPPKISNGQYGYLLTIYKPVYNHHGQCVCYAGIDFSMDELSNYGVNFICDVIAMFSGSIIFIFVLGLSFVENNIVMPVNTMAHCARNFAYNDEEAREKNIERIKALSIKTNDEIENLYSAFVKTTEDSVHYFENLKRAKIEVAVMDELAHKDALTGIKNKAAYNKDTVKLENDIAAGVANFCIIMIDVNFLKKINDTFGHERGNEYLINACNLACDVFGKDNVYRVGGDEFVVIFDGDKISICDDKVTYLRAMIEKFRADESLQAWEKVSAAVGVAYYQAGVDKTVEEVFKRADSDMYKNKLAMKAVRKD